MKKRKRKKKKKSPCTCYLIMGSTEHPRKIPTSPDLNEWKKGALCRQHCSSTEALQANYDNSNYYV